MIKFLLNQITTTLQQKANVQYCEPDCDERCADECYTEELEQSYQRGYDEGYEEGYNDACAEIGGENDDYDQGFQDGYADAIRVMTSPAKDVVEKVFKETQTKHDDAYNDFVRILTTGSVTPEPVKYENKQKDLVFDPITMTFKEQ